MGQIDHFTTQVAEFFAARLGASLVEAYKLGSLAHGGFSKIYSDIDVGLWLNCNQPPEAMAELLTQARSFRSFGATLSAVGGGCR